MSAPHDPAAGGAGGSPLLALLERLARSALAGASGAGAVRLAGIAPAPDGATVLLRLRGLGGLLDTTLPLRVTIGEVGEQVTRCTLSLPERGGLGRLLGGGLERLPRPLLEAALARLGPGVATLDGDTLLLHHRALVERLRHLT